MAATAPQMSEAEALRRARKIRGETLEQAAARTRISIEYLEALEAGAPLSAFPGPTYARLFLRTYARHLGLDEERATRAFSLRHDGPLTPTAPASLPVALPRPVSRLRTDLGPAMPKGLGRVKRASTVSRIRLGLATRRPHRILPGRLRLTPAGNGSTPRRPTALIAGAVGLAVVLVAAAVGLTLRSRSATPGPAAPRPIAERLPELPRGGREILPRYRVVAFYGTAKTERLGVLGVGTPAHEAQALLEQARPYRYDRPIMPVFELITVVASYHPGPDGQYRFRQPPEMIQAYLDAIRAVNGLLVLDIQPGRADFLSEIKPYRSFLEQPDVGLALDGEWHVGPDQVPGVTIGSVDASTVNRAATYLSGIVRRGKLPQKLFLVHQFTPPQIKDKRAIRRTVPGLAVVLDIDGYGAQNTKISKYNLLTGERDGFYHGVKLYYRQDVGLMRPTDVLGLRPTPDVIIYQ